MLSLESPPNAGLFQIFEIIVSRPDCVVETGGIELSAYHPVVEPASETRSAGLMSVFLSSLAIDFPKLICVNRWTAYGFQLIGD